MTLYIPNKNNITKTSDSDPIMFHYYPLIGWVYRKRLAMSMSMLGEVQYESLLEIGYGSGLLLPELKKHCKNLYGLDLHENKADVYKMLKLENIEATLESGSILSLPYENNSFDAIVSVSLLEHMKDLETAIKEIKRVLKKDGVAILSFPVKNKITNMFYSLFGYDPSEIHPSSHNRIKKYVAEQLHIDKTISFPSTLHTDYALYMSLKTHK